MQAGIHWKPKIGCPIIVTIKYSPLSLFTILTFYYVAVGASLVENPPADAGDTDLIPDPERAHLPCRSLVHAPQLFSLCPRAWELQLLKPAFPKACALQQKMPLQ